MDETVEAAKASDSDTAKADEVPAELRLAYKDELATKALKEKEPTPASSKTASTDYNASYRPQTPETLAAASSQPPTSRATPATRTTVPMPMRTVQLPTRPTPVVLVTSSNGVPAWIDKAIGGVVACLVIMVVKKIIGL